MELTPEQMEVITNATHPNDIPNDKIPCSECGEFISFSFTNWESLRDSLHCFTCNFWFEHTKREDDPRVVIVDGSFYSIGDEHVKGMRGFGGRKFIINFHDGRKEVTTNLWHGGSIPDRFIHLFPDNATFEKEEKWKWIGDQKYLTGP